MDIAAIQHTSNSARVSSVTAAPSDGMRGGRTENSPLRRGGDGADTVEVSPQARKAAADIRGDLVDRVKLEIQSGTYENLKKLDAAIDRMMTDLR